VLLGWGRTGERLSLLRGRRASVPTVELRRHMRGRRAGIAMRPRGGGLLGGDGGDGELLGARRPWRDGGDACDGTSRALHLVAVAYLDFNLGYNALKIYIRSGKSNL
jgi:hypothetical protein